MLTSSKTPDSPNKFNTRIKQDKAIFRFEENNGTYFGWIESDTLQNIIKTSCQLNTASEDCPIIIISVIVGERNGLRPLFTEWLISYFTKKKDVNLEELAAELGGQQNFKHFNSTNAKPRFRKNVFLWSAPTLKTFGAGRNYFNVWILYTDYDGLNLFGDSFLARVSSTIFTINCDDQARIREHLDHKNIPPLSFDTHYECVTDVVPKDGLECNQRTSAQKFLQRVRMTPFEYKKNNHGRPLTFRTLIPFMQAVVERPAFLYSVADSSNNSAVQSLVQYNIVNEKVNTFSKMKDHRIKLKKAPPETTMPAIEDIKNLTLRSNICLGNVPALTIETFKCEKDGKYPQSLQWIQRLMTEKILEELADRLCVEGQHNCPNFTEEVQALFKVITLYQHELRNMFDNYVCFDGKEDGEQLRRFLNNASTRATGVQKAYECVHINLVQYVLPAAMQKLQSFYLDYNDITLNAENELANNIIERIQEKYEQKIRFYFDREYHIRQPQIVDAVHVRLVEYCIGILVRALDYSGKSNQALSTSSVKLRANLHNRFSKLKHKFPTKQNNHFPTISSTGKTVMKDNCKNNVTADSDRYEINVAIANYVELVGKCDAISSKEQIIMNHRNFYEDVKPKFGKNDQIELQQRLEGYFQYLLEIYEEGSQNCDILPTDTSPLCLYISENRVRAVVRKFDGDLNIYSSQNGEILIPTEVGRTHKRHLVFSGWNSQSIITRSVKDTRSFDQLRALIYNLKQYAEKKVGFGFSRLVLILPNWLQLNHLMNMRKAAKICGFIKIYLMKETSACAHMALQGSELLINSPKSNNILVVVYVMPAGVQIEIFARTKSDPVTTKMLAIVACEKPMLSQYSCGSCNLKMTKKQRADWERDFSDSVDCQAYENFLHSLYDKALKQLDGRIKNLEKHCLIMSLSVKWRVAFSNFISSRDNLNRVNDLSQNYIVTAALQLSVTPEMIRRLVVDHTAVSSPVIFDEGILPDSSNVVTCQPISHNFLKSGSIEIQNIVSLTPPAQISNQANLLKKKQVMLEKCNLMRSFVVDGKNRFGVLMKKIVNEAIDQAEAVALEAEATAEMINAEAEELTRICLQHNLAA